MANYVCMNVMIRFTLGQRWNLGDFYYEKIVQHLVAEKAQYRACSIHKFIAKVCKTRFIFDCPSLERVRAVHTPENIDAVAVILHEYPSTSTRLCS